MCLLRVLVWCVCAVMSQPLVEVGATDVDKRACDNVQTYVTAKISSASPLMPPPWDREQWGWRVR